MRISHFISAIALCFISVNIAMAFSPCGPEDGPGVTSTQEEAILFVDSIKELNPSEHWPNIKPALFLENLQSNVHKPMSIYPGRGTNFCGYGALTYLFLQDDPLGYVKLLLELYEKGDARFGKCHFTPSDEVRDAAGTLIFKGVLDIHPAEQMWYLCLADHFKGYLNFFNRKYDPGDENTFWASVNYAKFNRMVRKLLNYHVRARGSDLLRPHSGNTYEFIREKLRTGTVVLYINNRILHKKKLERIKLAVPTHFVVLQDILKSENTITLTYWDYGSRTRLQLRYYFLKKIIFGISHCTKKS
jgi:hypothetical protein